MLKDYLNFYCNSCQKNLCKEHYHAAVSCPFKTSEDLSNDKEELNINKEEFIKQPPLICSFNICKDKIYNSIGYECKMCKAIFCLKHRIESDHQCPNVKVSLKEKYVDNKNKFKERLAELKNKK